jgi:hypothetical protein
MAFHTWRAEGRDLIVVLRLLPVKGPGACSKPEDRQIFTQARDVHGRQGTPSTPRTLARRP